MLNKIRNLFSRNGGDNIAIVSMGTGYEELPHGFFQSIGQDETVQIGFNCNKCKHTYKFGAQNGVVHCAKREMPPGGPLPIVKWGYASATTGCVPCGDANCLTIVDSDDLPGQWNGETLYEPVGGGLDRLGFSAPLAIGKK